MFFVFYEYDYGIEYCGLQEFETIEEVTTFIEGCMKDNNNADIDDFTVIEGVKRKLTAVEKVISVKVEY